MRNPISHIHLVICVMAILVALPQPAQASVKTSALSKAGQYVIRLARGKLGKEAAEAARAALPFAGVQAAPGTAQAALDFIWKNKCPVSLTTGLAAFLVQPKAFVDGAVGLVGQGLAPATETAKAVSTTIAAQVNWTIILGLALLAGVVCFAFYVRAPSAKKDG